MAARAITAGELTKLRTDGQWVRPFLAFLPPATIYTARVNQTFSTTDEQTEITYDTGSGTLANVKIGYTLWIGSTAGAYDLGFARIRKAPTSTIFYISEESKIAWADNLFLTIVQDFQLLPKHIFLNSSGTTFMDVDVAYSDQHATPNPVPVLGPFVQVLKLGTNGTASLAFNGSSSFVIGSTISTYAWVCSTASGSSGTGTATPTFTFNTTGWHLVECTVTAANSKTKIGYRWVYVYSDTSLPVQAFRVDECSGDADSGGWTAKVTLWAEAALTSVVDRALCVLFVEDHYGTEATSLGPVTGAENVIMWGWIGGETIVEPPTGRGGEVQFTIEGPAAWLSKIAAFPVGLEDVQTTPATWIEFEDLTVRKAVWHFLEWRTTATTILDIQLTSDTRGLPTFEGARGRLWDQLVQNCGATILAFPRCDRYGKLYVEIDPQYIFEADRSSFPTVMDLTDEDWSGQVQGERVTREVAAQVDHSGIYYADGTAVSYFGLAPGHVPFTYGDWQVMDRFLAFSTQANHNTMTGLIAGRANNQFPAMTFTFPANNRFFDIAPSQYFRHSIDTTDTPRGFSYTNKKYIPRRVRLIFGKNNVLTCEVEAEAETLAALAVTGDAPSTPPDLPLTPISPFPPIVFNPGLKPTATEAWFIQDQDKIVYSAQVFDDTISQPTWAVAVNPPTDQIWANVGSLAVTPDGGTVYVSGRMASDSTLWAIWKSSNAKSAAPTWTEILKGGDAMGATTVRTGSNPFGRLMIWGTRLIVMVDNAGVILPRYAEYSGSAWTFSTSDASTLSHGEVAATYRRHMHLTTISADPMLVKSMPGNSAVDSFTADTGTGPRGGQLWRNLIGGNVYGIYRNGGAGAFGRVRNATGATDVLTGFQYGVTGHGINTPITLRGAVRNVHLALVDDNGAGVGVIYVSTNGTSFASGATWKPGIADFLQAAGGLRMCWLLFTTTNSNEMFRTSTDAFATPGTSKVGNYWTSIQQNGLAFNARDLNVVFRN